MGGFSDRKLSDIARIDADHNKRENFNTLFGDRIMVERTADILEQFQYNINTKDLASTTNGTGTITQANSMAKLSTGTDTDGAAKLESIKKVRYRPSFEAFTYFTVIFENGGVADCTQYCGPFNTDNGYYLGYNGTDFVVGARYDGTDTQVTSNNFDNDGTFGLYEPTKLNIFRITWGWLGTAPISFEWLGPDSIWHVVHVLAWQNTLTKPHSDNPVLPICFDITKTDGATDVIVHTASWCGGLNGEESNAGDRFFTGTVGPQAESTEAVLINFQNVGTFQSKTNRVPVEAVLLGMSTEGTKSAIIKVYKNLTISGASWANVDATNSVMQSDTAGTVTPDDANLLFAFPMAKADSNEIDVSGMDFELLPNETATVTGQSSSNNDFTFTARWKEKF